MKGVFSINDSDSRKEPRRPSSVAPEAHAGFLCKESCLCSNHFLNTRNMNHLLLCLITTRPRCLLISLQPHQQFPELLLARTRRTSPRALAAQIDQLGNTLPTRAACARVFTAGEEFFFILARLGKRLVFFPIVILVELVRPFLCRGDCVCLFLRGDFGAAFQIEITAFPPLSVGTKGVLVGETLKTERRMVMATGTQWGGEM